MFVSKDIPMATIRTTSRAWVTDRLMSSLSKGKVEITLLRAIVVNMETNKGQISRMSDTVCNIASCLS